MLCWSNGVRTFVIGQEYECDCGTEDKEGYRGYFLRILPGEILVDFRTCTARNVMTLRVGCDIRT